MSLGFFDLFALLLRRDLIIICFRRFLLKWGFWFPSKIVVLLGLCLSKTETKLIPDFVVKFCFLKSMFLQNRKKIICKDCMGSHCRHTIKKIQFILVTIILFEISIYWFLSFKLFKHFFGNSKYHMMMITQTNFKGICLHKWKFRICN